MYERLLDFLRCPECRNKLALEALTFRPDQNGSEIWEGLLHCDQEHWFPIIRGIPRMLPGALEESWPHLAILIESSSLGRSVRNHTAGNSKDLKTFDARTRLHFSLEWEHHEVGGKTWGIDLDERVSDFFLNSMGVKADELAGMIVLDAGCGNGSQSAAYTNFGTEVIAMDLSSGIEHGQMFRHMLPGARPDRVHYVQADLQSPPLAPGSVDVIHSAGVLHHTPDTRQTFNSLCPLLRPGGLFYIWLYKYEPVVTPVVNAIRAVTTRIPPLMFASVARKMSRPFQIFCSAVDALGIRSYPRLSRREAALALMDIFGSPYAHYHSFTEVARWYEEEGFDEVQKCNESRRGFGACARRRFPQDDS